VYVKIKYYKFLDSKAVAILALNVSDITSLKHKLSKQHMLQVKPTIYKNFNLRVFMDRETDDMIFIILNQNIRQHFSHRNNRDGILCTTLPLFQTSKTQPKASFYFKSTCVKNITVQEFSLPVFSLILEYVGSECYLVLCIETGINGVK